MNNDSETKVTPVLNETPREDASTAEGVTAKGGEVIAEDEKVTSEAVETATKTETVTSEADKAAAVIEKVTPEADKVTVEDEKVSSETVDAAAEDEKVSSETVNAAAEDEKVSSETVNAAAEDEKVSSETDKAAAEDEKVISKAVETTAKTGEVTSEGVEVTGKSKNDPIPSMEDFEDQISKSFIKIREGEIVKGTVIGISDTEITVDLNYYAEGVIKPEDLSNDPRFSIKTDVAPGQEITALVLKEDDGQGNILLSKKEADNILSWTTLKNHLENRTVLKVKIAQTVRSGVIIYLEGIRGFIPASQLSLHYVENLESWVNKEIDVIVINVDEDNKKLVLSGKEVERDRALEDKNSKISRLQIGLVTKGTVEKIVPYGAFINIGDGLSGLVHISQISGKRIKSPNEVIKEGEEVKVKIIEVKNGKVSLSMKAVDDKADVLNNVDKVPFEYSDRGEASTNLASLLSKIKL